MIPRYVGCLFNADDDASYTVTGMDQLMLIEFIACVLPMVVAYFYFKDAPPTPPSHSTQLKIQHDQHLHHSRSSNRPSDRSLHTLQNEDLPNMEREARLLSEHSGSSASSSQLSNGNKLYESFNHEGSTNTSAVMSPIQHAGTTPTLPTTMETNEIPPMEATNEEQWKSLKDDLWLLLRNKDYLILFCVFSIGVGFFNSVMTLLNQIVGPYGYRYVR
jgi:hypothetical protein